MERTRRYLNRMLDSLQVAARHRVSAKAHGDAEVAGGDRESGGVYSGWVAKWRARHFASNQQESIM
jgi:hypothetical protein